MYHRFTVTIGLGPRYGALHPSADRGTRTLQILIENHHECFNAILTKRDVTANMQIVGGTY